MAPFYGSSNSQNRAQFIPPGTEPKDRPRVQHATKMLLIDSRDRDLRYDGPEGPFSFTIWLDDPNRKSVGVSAYELVHSVELKAFSMPKVSGEAYVVLDIEELAGQMDSTDVASHGKFTVAYYDGIESVSGRGMQPGDFKVIKGSDIYNRIVTFDPPIIKLAKLKVKIRKHGGAVVQPSDCGGVNHCSFLLQIDVQTRSIH